MDFDLRWVCVRCHFIVPLLATTVTRGSKLPPAVTLHVCFPEPPVGLEDTPTLTDLYCHETMEPPILEDNVKNPFDVCGQCEHGFPGVHWCDKEDARIRGAVIRRQRRRGTIETNPVNIPPRQPVNRTILPSVRSGQGQMCVICDKCGRNGHSRNMCAAVKERERNELKNEMWKHHKEWIEKERNMDECA